ncbi:MAG TPA: DUF3224 domain-containing protein [Terriglobales bacterium]|nr:DUF3224 domain-containing protein [Terriglobales bacterium]
MTTHLETRFKIDSWDEQPYRELDDGRKFTRAVVALSVAEQGIEARATWDAVLYYAADGTSSYAGLMHVEGRLGDRTGSFVMEGTGRYDGTEARGESTVVPATATGELRGLHGTGQSVSTHEDYPFMPLTLDYAVE